MNERKYPAVNLKQPFLIFLLLVLIGGPIYFIVAVFLIHYTFPLFLLIPVVFELFWIGLLVNILTTEICINDEFICKQSFLGKKCLRISEIKRIVVAEQVDNLSFNVDESSFDKTRIMGVLVITLSDREDFNPNSFSFKKQKNALRFHYRKDLYEDLKATLKNIQP